MVQSQHLTLDKMETQVPELRRSSEHSVGGLFVAGLETRNWGQLPGKTCKPSERDNNRELENLDFLWSQKCQRI